MGSVAAVWRLPGVFIVINFLFLFITSKLLTVNSTVRYHLLLVQYLILAETLFVLITRSLYNRIVDKWPRQSKTGFILRMMLAPVFILGQSQMLLHVVLVATEPKLLSLITGYTFGFLMYLIAAVIVVEVLYHVGLIIRNKSVTSIVTQVKTDAQERVMIIVTLLLSCFCFYFGMRNSSFPDVVRVRIPIQNLPASFNNTVIVQLSDMHIGVVNGRSSLEKVIKIANSLKPDLIAVTGDTAEGGVSKIRHALEPLGNLRAKFGVYITTGNL